MARPVLSAGSRAVIAASYAKSTYRKYSDAVSDFLLYCDDLSFDTTSSRDFDIYLTEYLFSLHRSRQGKGKASATVYGILSFMPHLKARLPLSLQFLKGINRLQPVKAYPPLTWDLTCTIAIRMMLNGSYRAGIGCLIAFHCFLRVGELCGLRPADIVDARSSVSRVGVASPHMVLILRHTKTGPNQEVTVTDTFLASLIRELVRTTPPSDAVFCRTSAAFRSRFHRACGDLQLSTRYVPHSLRHGGATRAFLEGVRMDDILLRGRWAAHKSAKHYIQSGRVLLAAAELPLSLRVLSASIARDLPIIISLTQSHLARGGQHSH